MATANPLEALYNPIEITADINAGSFGTTPEKATQGDTIKLTVNVTLGGNPFPLDGVKTALLVTTRPDHEVVVDVGEVTGGSQAVFRFSRKATAVAGSLKIVVQLYGEGGNRVSTLSGKIRIDGDAAGGSYEPNDDEKALFEIVLGEGPKVIKEAKDATIAALGARDELVTTLPEALAEINARIDDIEVGNGDIDGGSFDDVSEGTSIDGGEW